MAKGGSWIDRWIKKGGDTPIRSRTPKRGPLFGPNMLR
jgi:ribosomal protein L15